jgi:hypothetical protein
MSGTLASIDRDLLASVSGGAEGGNQQQSPPSEKTWKQALNEWTASRGYDPDIDPNMLKMPKFDSDRSMVKDPPDPPLSGGFGEPQELLLT